jgi:uncharacterized membrane protein YhhN
VTGTLLVLAGLAAVGDWLAVHQRLFRIEYALKPLTLVLLIAVAVSADAGDAKPWLIAALVFGLAGDVALMLSARDGRTDPPFLLGLGSFLLGHLCYLVAFGVVGLFALDLLAGLLIAGGLAALALPSILRGATAAAGRPFAALVAGYAAFLGAMATLAVGTGIWATAIGGVLFLVSDTLIARQRFVRRIPYGDVLVTVTYHLAQALVLIGLVASA